MFDLVSEIWQTLRTSKLRTFLTGISVAWGIFMLILLLAIANGVINSATNEMSRNDPNRITLWGGYTSRPYHGMKDGRNIPLKNKHIEALEEDLDDISGVSGVTRLTGVISTNKDYLNTSQCRGMAPEALTGQYKLLAGRKINSADMEQMRKVMMLNRTSLPVLFDDTLNVLGKKVQVGNFAFTVVGVFDHWDNSPIVPYTTARALSQYSDRISVIDVHLQGVTTAEQSGAIEKQMRQTMARIENFDPDDPGAVYTFDRFASSIQSATALNILNYAMWTIGLLTLITGIVGVSNIMFVSVRERTHEIGIRRAIGAKPRSILVQVVLESIALTTIFGYIGIVMGTIATEIVKRVFAGSRFMVDPSVDLRIALQVTAALIVAGALAGIFPALKAIKVRPVEALRDE